jgi:glucose/arabinose dehydrogenase
MSKISLTRYRRTQTAIAALAALTSQACSSDRSTPGATGFSGSPGAGAESSGEPSAGVGGSGSSSAGASSSDMPSPVFNGNGGADDGSSASAGTGGADMLGAGGTSASDVPTFEQDDPNLHPPDSAYERVEIPVPVDDPMSLDIDEQERVYVLERAGSLKIWYPTENRVVEAGTIPVFSGGEDGALSMSLDPSFASNGFIYVYYSSPQANPNGGGNQQVVSRFHIENDQLDLASESVLLRVPDQRQVAFHVAGGMDFDSQGNLYISTGDNTDPFQSNGFSPHDERPGRALFDSQRTAGNSRELRGKILRIKPTAEGGYDIPEGNLFSEDQGAPEIYIMGNRNPWRIAVDPATNWLYWGEVGPDAGADALGTRGPRGYDEFNQAKGAGFFGWPYCIADNIPYVDIDFVDAPATPTVNRGPFNCAAPVNNSPNKPANALTQLPPAQPAWIAYSYGASPYPEALGATGARTAAIGDVYRWKPGGSSNKLPRYYDGSVFLIEFMRKRLAEVRTDADGNITQVDPFFPSFQWPPMPATGYNGPSQMRISPSGVLHVSVFGGVSAVYRVNYVGTNGQ